MTPTPPPKGMSATQVDISMPEQRGFAKATRLIVTPSHLSPNEELKLLEKEIQSLVDDTNRILMRRDGLPYSGRTKAQMEETYDTLAEEYAEKMVLIEEKHEIYKKKAEALRIPNLSK